MFYPAEQTERISAEQRILRSERSNGMNLCQYKSVSCIRCCLPHIGGDSHVEDSERERSASFGKGKFSGFFRHASRYLGPGSILMKFRNFHPLKDPQINASQYEDSFPDVGRKEMEKRFSERRRLFLDIYNPEQPRQTLLRYMKAAQENEGYRYRPAADAGPVSLFLAGSVPANHRQKGELPECQLLGFVDGKGRAGCMAHPLAETSCGFDGRDHAGFFHHTGCCKNVGCQASEEFRFLSASAVKIFDQAVAGMSWYEYSRHATSVLVYYLRSYDHLFQKLDIRAIPDATNLRRLVEFTNKLYDEWPLRTPGHDSDRMSSLDILLTDIPLPERITYIALDSRFKTDHFASQLRQARKHLEDSLELFARATNV